MANFTRIMNKRIDTLLLPLAAAAFLLTSGIVTQAAAQASGQPAMNQNKQAVQTGYAPVNGLRIYFEIHDVANRRQPPLVLLHDGGDTIQTSFGQILPALAGERQVIAFEQQGYGHTADRSEERRVGKKG